MTVAPGGIVAASAGPAYEIRLPVTMTVLSARVAPLTTSITETWVIAIVS
jgi:hypothetical protein